MTLLGFDTSLPTTSACLVRDDGRTFTTEPPAPERLLGPATHSSDLMPELERLLGRSETRWEDLDEIAVGVGPGTFTGLRIGVATARALGQALRIPIHPVSSLEALAAGVAVGRHLRPGQPIVAVIDARRGQVFAAVFRVPEGGALDARGPSLEALVEPVVVDPERLLDRIERIGGNPICAGDWAIESRNELERAGAEVPPVDTGLHAIDARAVCTLAAAVEPVAPEQVEPVYLRLPDAEINRRLAGEPGR